MEKKYVIYSYEFEDYVYVGLTKNLQSRHECRKNDSFDTVNKFCKEHNINIPEPKILETSLNSLESQSKELNWVQYYLDLGKTMLNKNPCGIFISSLGGNSDVKNESPSLLCVKKCTKTKQRQIDTTYEKCHSIALKYEYKSDFQKDYGYEYRFSKKMGWLNEFTWLKSKKPVKNNLPLTYENYLNIVKNYKTKSEFSKGNKSFYLLGLKEGWNNIHFTKNSNVSVPLLYSGIKLDDIIDELLLYKTKTELNKKNHGLYECCRKNGWLDLVYKKNKKVSLYQKHTSECIHNVDTTKMLTNDNYPSYFIDISEKCVYHKLKTKIHKLSYRTNRLGFIVYCINVNGKYIDLLYHNLLGTFLNKKYNAVNYKNGNFNDVSIENLEFINIDMENVKPFPQYPGLYLNKNGTIYDSNFNVIYYGTKLTENGWVYKSINLGKLCFSLFKDNIMHVNGKINFINGDIKDYSINNISFIYNETSDILKLQKNNEFYEFTIKLSNGSQLTICKLSDKLTCNKLYEDLKERIKNNSYIDQWIYNFIENILPLYIEENKDRNNIKKRTESNGCYWWKPRKKWKSKIYFNDKEYTLGYFDSFEAGKFLYETAVLSVKYGKFIEWYYHIEKHRELCKNIF